MSRLLVGVTLERICKAVLLLCLLHFLIIMILYFDVYAQRLDFFSRFNVRNSSSRALPYVNISRPNGTAGPLGPELLGPSAKSVRNNTVTEKPLPPCPEMPPGLGEFAGESLCLALPTQSPAATLQCCYQVSLCPVCHLLCS